MVSRLPLTAHKDCSISHWMENRSAHYRTLCVGSKLSALHAVRRTRYNGAADPPLRLTGSRYRSLLMLVTLRVRGLLARLVQRGLAFYALNFFLEDALSSLMSKSSLTAM